MVGLGVYFRDWYRHITSRRIVVGKVLMAIVLRRGCIYELTSLCIVQWYFKRVNETRLQYCVQLE